MKTKIEELYDKLVDGDCPNLASAVRLAAGEIKDPVSLARFGAAITGAALEDYANMANEALDELKKHVKEALSQAGDKSPEAKDFKLDAEELLKQFKNRSGLN